jgi:hypothetical protein
MNSKKAVSAELSCMPQPTTEIDWMEGRANQNFLRK